MASCPPPLTALPASASASDSSLRLSLACFALAGVVSLAHAGLLLVEAVAGRRRRDGDRHATVVGATAPPLPREASAAPTATAAPTSSTSGTTRTGPPHPPTSAKPPLTLNVNGLLVPDTPVPPPDSPLVHPVLVKPRGSSLSNLDKPPLPPSASSAAAAALASAHATTSTTTRRPRLASNSSSSVPPTLDVSDVDFDPSNSSLPSTPSTAADGANRLHKHLAREQARAAHELQLLQPQGDTQLPPSLAALARLQRAASSSTSNPEQPASSSATPPMDAVIPDLAGTRAATGPNALILDQARAYVKALEDRVRQLESVSTASTSSKPPDSPTSRPRRASEHSAPGSRRRVVLKIGTASLVDEHGLRIGQVATVMDVVAELKRMDFDVLLVCSGAVGTGSQVLHIRERPTSRPKIRALAAVGQARLIRELNHVLGAVGVESAQILLSYSNLGEYDQSLNAQNTINELFLMNVVPIVNENDTVATESSRFGDNDRLAAMVATVIDADYLFLLTDVNGVYTADPRRDPTATRIELVTNVDETRARIKVDGAGTSFSTGGMDSKLVAAQIATRAGVRTIIMRAADVRGVPEYLGKQNAIADAAVQAAGGASATATIDARLAVAPFGTVFVEQRRKVAARKKWLQSLPPKGKILVDDGAAKAMRQRKTLFAAGVRGVTGRFGVGDPIHVCPERSPDVVLAVGFTNYGSADVAKVAGKRSEEIPEVLGAGVASVGSEPGAVVDRENLAWSTSS